MNKDIINIKSPKISCGNLFGGGRFFRYCLIGCSGALLDLLIYSFLINVFFIHYLIANVISVFVGITNNFFFNSYLNFKRTDKLLIRYFSFCFIGILGLVISEILLYVLIEMCVLNTIFAKIVIIFVITIIQYTLNKLLTFRNFNKEEEV